MPVDLIPQQPGPPALRRVSPLLAVNVACLVGGAVLLVAAPKQYWWVLYVFCVVGVVPSLIHLIRHPAQDLNAFPRGFVFQPKPDVGSSDPAALGVNGAQTSAFLDGLSRLGHADWERVARAWLPRWRNLRRSKQARMRVMGLVAGEKARIDAQPLVTEVHRLSVAGVIPGPELLAGLAATTVAALALYCAAELDPADVEILYVPFQAVLPRESLLAR